MSVSMCLYKVELVSEQGYRPSSETKYTTTRRPMGVSDKVAPRRSRDSRLSIEKLALV